MKYLVPSFLAAALLAFAGTAHAQSMVKIGTVDMKKIFEGYYKTKDAEQRINEARNQAKKELEERMETGQKAMAEVNKLNAEIDNPALSREAKETKSKVRDERLAELKNMDREITEFRQTREKQLQEQSGRMRQGIVDDITKVVGEKVKAESFDLVFDKSGMSFNGVSVVMNAKESYDFTDSVITILNKNKGSEPPPAAAVEKPAPKAEPAKKK
ncbi:MAG: OmpH family outer membrane protein [Chthoniobacteraceae bacterium]